VGIMIKDLFNNLIQTMKEVIPADRTYQSLNDDEFMQYGNSVVDSNVRGNEDSYVLNDDLK
jgi:hypothetical protein